MIRALLGALLIAHGLIHAAIYSIPTKPDEKAPFDAGHSWVLAGIGVEARPARLASTMLGILTAALFALAGLLLLVDTGAWTSTLLVAVAVGLLLKVGYFHPWLTIGVLLDLGLLTAAIAQWPTSLH